MLAASSCAWLCSATLRLGYFAIAKSPSQNQSLCHQQQKRLGFNLVFFVGRVGAINLEQLDVLLNSLKTYWDYSNQKSFLAEIKASPTPATRAENELAYEL